MSSTVHYYLAQAYGRGAYSQSNYSCTTAQQQAGTCASSTTTASSNSLANTGIAIAGFVTVACLLIFVALVVRVWRRKKPAAAQPEL